MEKKYDVMGLGNAIMDLLVQTNEEVLFNLNLKKGEFHLVDEQRSQILLRNIEQRKLKIETIPGGSSANTIKALAFLGGKAILCGKVGTDKYGQTYIQEMKKQGVISRINTHASTTGHALTFITPDAERTFSVHLGAAVTLSKGDILEQDVQRSKVLHLEGYQIEGPTRETILQAITLAKKHKTLISIDLADPGVIRRNKEFCKKLVYQNADIIFVNETEAKEFTGLEGEQAAKELAGQSRIAVVKLGSRGSLVCKNNKITFIESFPAKAIDSTGAGDSYAAGFLYGFCQNWPLERSAKLGSLLAARVVEKKGVHFSGLDSEELKGKV